MVASLGDEARATREMPSEAGTHSTMPMTTSAMVRAQRPGSPAMISNCCLGDAFIAGLISSVTTQTTGAAIRATASPRLE